MEPEALDTLRVLLLLLIAGVVALGRIPVKCNHPCSACDAERERERRRDEEAAHEFWHVRAGIRYPKCRYCERDRNE